MSRLLAIPIVLVLLITTACANHMTIKRESQVQSSNTIFLRPTVGSKIFWH